MAKSYPAAESYLRSTILSMAQLDIPWESFSQRAELRPSKGKLPAFVWIKPNYENINTFLRTGGHLALLSLRQINTIHVGVTGAGKSTMIGALQVSAFQTCAPQSTAVSAPFQTKLHTTRIGRSLDTQGLNEGCVEGQTDVVTDAKQTQTNIQVLLASGISHCHAIFTHIKPSIRADASLINAIQHSIEIANNILVVRKLDEEKCNAIFAAFDMIEDSLKDFLKQEIVIIDPEFSNIFGASKVQEGDQEPLFPITVESDNGFHWKNDRDGFILFIRSALSKFMDKPIRVVEQNEYCKRGCGNKGDSRSFAKKCHGEPELCHPPGCKVKAYTLDVDHPEPKPKDKPCHRDLINKTSGEFCKGRYAAAAAAFHGGDVVEPVVDNATGVANLLAGVTIAGRYIASKADIIAKTAPKVTPFAQVCLGVTAAGSVVGGTSFVLGKAGVGRWSCCNAISEDAPGCAEQWGCCGAWQSLKPGAAKAGCLRKICKGCKSDWDQLPSKESGEMRCSRCNDYVGAIPEGIVLKNKGPCWSFEEGAKHDVASA